MGRKLSSMLHLRKTEAKYKFAIILGVLLAACGGGIIAIGSFMRCCIYTYESNWFARTEVPLYFGGILATTGFIFLCSAAYYKKTGNQMLLIVLTIIVVLAVICEIGFVYAYISLNWKDFSSQHSDRGNYYDHPAKNSKHVHDESEINQPNTTDQDSSNRDAENNGENNGENSGDNRSQYDDYRWIWKKYIDQYTKKTSEMNTREEGRSDDDENESENDKYMRNKSLKLTLIILNAFSILLLLVSIMLSRQPNARNGKVTYKVIRKESSQERLIIRPEENTKKYSANYSSIQPAFSDIQPAYSEIQPEYPSTVPENTMKNTSIPTAPPLDSPPPYEDIFKTDDTSDSASTVEKTIS